MYEERHAEHLPGKENVRADWESRHIKDSSNWRLDINQLEARIGPFSIDLFASQTNAQLPVYCSWRPDPPALTVDALSLSWRNHNAYMFPAFALITRCLEKLIMLCSRGGKSNHDSPSVVQPAVVSVSAQELDGLSQRGRAFH